MNHHIQVIELFKAHFGEKQISGIEIGTAEGLLTKGLLLYLPNVRMIYAIDPYIHDSESRFEAFHPQEWHDDRLRQAQKALAVYEGRVDHIIDTSDNAVDTTPVEVDFVWIDGDHTPEQIEKDVINYYPKVVSGGIFGGHDSQLSVHIAKEIINKSIYEIILGDEFTWRLVK